ncbi:MAG: hypothetical protein EHM45_00565 [Desulfobacteraceae bacterium]|nr:MAG: hypothetical protein EHM45_00565 [Desulfobacteraceae bacterium]
MPITMDGDYQKILKETLKEREAGKILFVGPSGEKVWVYFLNGKVVQAISNEGKGKSEFTKVSQWKSGKCTISDITTEERRSLTKMEQQQPLPPAAKEEAKTGRLPLPSFENAQEVKLLIRGQNAKFLDLSNILLEIQKSKYSGEARITTSGKVEHILFYQGSPALSSHNKNISYSDALRLMDAPGATIDFYQLGEALSQAFLSVMDGEKVINGPANVIDINKVLEKAVKNRETGHIYVIYPENEKHYIFFYQGRPVGAYQVFRNWERIGKPFDIERAVEISYFRSRAIEPYLAKAKGPIIAGKDLQEFMRMWNDLVGDVAKKVGKKPVEKSIERHFNGKDLFVIDGISLQLPQSNHLDLNAVHGVFKEHCPEFLKEIHNIIGGKWLPDQLQEVQKGRKEILEKLSLNNIFSNIGG